MRELQLDAARMAIGAKLCANRHTGELELRLGC